MRAWLPSCCASHPTSNNPLSHSFLSTGVLWLILINRNFSGHVLHSLRSSSLPPYLCISWNEMKPQLLSQSSRVLPPWLTFLKKTLLRSLLTRNSPLPALQSNCPWQCQQYSSQSQESRSQETRSNQKQSFKDYETKDPQVGCPQSFQDQRHPYYKFFRDSKGFSSHNLSQQGQ